jgi:DNA-binding SARP family transcriptional activator
VISLDVLGPLRIVPDPGTGAGAGGPKQRLVLGALIVAQHRTVPVDRLAEILWSGRPPPTATGTIQAYVSRLRRHLGSGVIQRDSLGYRLDRGSVSIDVMRFDSLVAEAGVLASSAPAAAREVLAEALRLWRGPALVDFADQPFARSEIARLEEARASALEERLALDLDLGDNQGLIAELEALVSEAAHRERLWGFLMIALYRQGRQAEALRTFGRARKALVEVAGVEPGTALRSIELQILEQAPELLSADVLPSELPVGRWLEVLQGPDDPAARVTERATLLLDRADRLRQAGDPSSARRDHIAAVELADLSGDPRLLARATLGLVGDPEESVYGEAVDQHLLRRAELQLGPGPDGNRAMLTARRAVALADIGSPDASRLFDEAIAEAAEVGDPRAAAYVHRCWLRSSYHPDHLERRAATAALVVTIAGELGDRELRWLGLDWQGVALMETGGLQELLATADHPDPALEELPLRHWGFAARRVGLAMAAGDLQRAERDLDHLLALAGQTQLPVMLASAVHLVAVLRWWQGRLGELEEHIRGAGRYIAAAASLPQLLLGRGDDRLAAKELRALTPDGVEALLERDLIGGARLQALGMLGEVAAELGDEDRSAECYELLLPYADRCIVVHPGLTVLSHATHVLAVLAAALGQRQEATWWFEAATAHGRRMGAPGLVARTQVAYGRAVRRWGDPRGDRLVAAGRWTAERLGLRLVVDEADRRL